MASMSPELLFDRFLQNITSNTFKWSVTDPLCDMMYVRCTKDDDVYSIALGRQSLHGTLQWTYLPVTLQYLYLQDNFLTGTVPLQQLPPGLCDAYLNHNHFSGKLEFERAPQTLTTFSVSSNLLSGCLDFAFLPRGMTELWLDKNEFSETLHFEDLPLTLNMLDLSFNDELEGAFRKADLPA